MLILDRDRVVRGLNRSAARLGGSSIGSAIGEPSGMALRCVHHLAGDGGCGFSSRCGSCSLRAAILETFRTGAPRYRVEAFLEREAGRADVSLLVSVVPFGPRNDGLVLVTLEDVTERKRVETALKSSRANFHNTVECMEIGIIVADADGIARYVNPATEALLNRPYLELVGKRLEFPLVDGAATEVELLDGPRHHRFVDVRTTASRWEGKPAFLISLWDNTERRLAEESLRDVFRKLEDSHEQLKQAQLTLIQAAKLESVGTLAAGVAHEVKNPLQILLMGLRHLSRHLPPDNPEIQNTVDDMRAATQRADAIVRGLLEFSTSHQLDLHDEPVAAVVESSLNLVRYELVKHHVRLETDLPQTLPPLPMDRIKIEQVLVNLFLNAIDAMPAGGTLSIRAFAQDEHSAARPLRGSRPAAARNRATVIEVADTGPGIPPDRIARVFDPFFTTKSVGKGTGLGLTVVKNIIELHGGTIDIRNRRDGGLLVTLLFHGASHTAIGTGDAEVMI